MATEALTNLLEKANTDPEFRIELERDIDAAIKPFNLTDEEVDAVKSRRTARLKNLDVDLKLAKGFAHDNGTKIALW